MSESTNQDIMYILQNVRLNWLIQSLFYLKALQISHMDDFVVDLKVENVTVDLNYTNTSIDVKLEIFCYEVLR